MKNQNDWILSIVFAVLAIGATVYFFVAHRQPVTPPKPEEVPVAKLQLPKGAVTLATSLPGGGSNSGAGAASSGPSFGGRGGPAGLSGPGGPPAGIPGVPGGDTKRRPGAAGMTK
jgi:hypothetical protein